MEPIEVEAEEITSLATLDTNKVLALIDGMDAELANCHKAALELKAEPGVIYAMSDEDVQRFETQSKKALDAANDARKRFKAEWQSPMKKVEELFKSELSTLEEIHETYRGERISREVLVKDKKMDVLERAYLDFCEDNGVPVLAQNIPFDRIFEKTWLNGGKRWSEAKATGLMLEKVTGILKDWDSLKSATLHFPDEAYLDFFNSLDLAATIHADNQRFEQRQALDELKQQEQGNQEYRTEQDERGIYLLTIQATEQELESLLGFMTLAGIRGHYCDSQRFETEKQLYEELKKHA